MKIKGFEDTIKWYNKNATKYAEATLVHSSQDQIEEFLKFIPEGGKILDAGCGAGRDTNIFTQRVCEAIGIDLSDGLLKEARRRYPKSDFVQGNLLKLPFSDETFDGIWAHASLLHFETVEEVIIALKEFKRVIKKNGTLHVLVKAQTGVNKTEIVTDALSKHDRFFQFFSKEEVENLLKKSGFKVMKLEQYKEIERDPKGRPEVVWILALAKK